MASSLNVDSASELLVVATDNAEVNIQNGGPGTIYYKSTSGVSTTSYDGTIAAGASLQSRANKWIISSATSKVFIEDTAHTDDTRNVHGIPNTADLLLDDRINVTHSSYGATGDGVTNDAAAIQAAYDAAQGRPIYLPAGTYNLGTTQITGSYPLNMYGDGPGKTKIKYTATASPVSPFYIAGTQGNAVALSGNAAAAATSLSLTTTGLAANDYLLLYSSTAWSAELGSNKGEIVRVKSITSSSALAVDGALADGYLTSATASVKKITFVNGSHVEGISFENSDIAGAGVAVLWFENTRDVRVTNCHFKEWVGTAVAVQHSIDFAVDKCSFEDGSQDFTLAHGYGVCALDACHGGTVSNCTSHAGHTIFTTSVTSAGNGIPRYITVSSCVAVNPGLVAFHTHVSGEGITFADCVVANGVNADSAAYPSGFSVHGKNCQITGGMVLNTQGWGVLVGSTALDLRIDGVRIDGAIDNATRDGIGIYVSGATGTVISNVVIDDCETAGIHLESTTKARILNSYIRKSASGGGVTSATDSGTIQDGVVVETSDGATYDRHISANGFVFGGDTSATLYRGGSAYLRTAASLGLGPGQQMILYADGKVQLTEMTEPSAPASNTVFVYAKDTGGGKTTLCARFPTGAVQTIATEP